MSTGRGWQPDGMSIPYFMANLEDNGAELFRQEYDRQSPYDTPRSVRGDREASMAAQLEVGIPVEDSSGRFYVGNDDMRGVSIGDSGW